MKPIKTSDPHRSQLLWTLLVALAVAASAFWQVASPHRFSDPTETPVAQRQPASSQLFN